MSLMTSLVVTPVENAKERMAEHAHMAVGQPAPINRGLRYAGLIDGARCEVRLRVVRIETPYQNVCRIEGTLVMPDGSWMFDCDGFSGHGKFYNSRIVHVQVTDETLAVTIDPFDQPAPTVYLHRA